MTVPPPPEPAVRPRVPRWVRIAAVLFGVWAALGCAAYLSQMTMTEVDIEQLPPGEAAMWRAMPGWVGGAYAIAVWGALVGAIALFMAKRVAIPILGLALLATLAQYGWSFTVAPREGLAQGALLFPVLILAMQVAALAVAVKARPFLR